MRTQTQYCILTVIDMQSAEKKQTVKEIYSEQYDPLSRSTSVRRSCNFNGNVSLLLFNSLQFIRKVNFHDKNTST